MELGYHEFEIVEVLGRMVECEHIYFSYLTGVVLYTQMMYQFHNPTGNFCTLKVMSEVVALKHWRYDAFLYNHLEIQFLDISQKVNLLVGK